MISFILMPLRCDSGWYCKGKLDATQSSGLTLYTLKSVCIFSVLLFIHFLQCWQGEFAYQSNASFVSDHFLYSHNLDSGVIGRNWMLVTLWVLRVKGLKIRTLSCMVGKTYLCTTYCPGADRLLSMNFLFTKHIHH